MKNSLYFICCIVLSVSTLTVSAQSGKTGKLRWVISDGTLTISGVGAMPNYKYEKGKNRFNSPWYSYLKNIVTVIISDGVTNIGENAFYVCEDVGLTFVNILGSETAIDDNFPNYCGLKSILIPNSVISIGAHAFRNCRNLASIVIPNSVMTIGISAFSDCRSLVTIEIPNVLTTLESYIFDGCSSMTSVAIPNSVTVIRYGAFRGCHSLTSVAIPNSTTTIGGHAFAYSRSLKSIIIPHSVVNIANTAFEDCDSLSEIINYATIPQRVRPYNTFSNVNETNCILRVPKISVTAYRSADAWKEFKIIANE